MDEWMNMGYYNRDDSRWFISSYDSQIFDAYFEGAFQHFHKLQEGGQGKGEPAQDSVRRLRCSFSPGPSLDR